MEKLKTDFLKYCSSYASKKTVAFYKNVLSCFDDFVAFTRLDIDDINKIDSSVLTDFISYMRFDRNVKNVSVRTYIRGFRVFLNWCYDNAYMLERVHSIKLPKDDRQLKIPLSEDEFRLCFEYLETLEEDLYDRNLCIFMLMLGCGLRAGEVRHLHVNDIDFNQGLVRVNNSKNNKSRIVPLPWDIRSYLKYYIDLSRPKGSKWLFLTKNENQLKKSTLDDLFRNIKSVCPRIHPHLLRHTFATSYIMGGGSLEVLRVLLGHTSYNVTQGYISLAAELSISHYDIYRIDDIFFDKFNYRKVD